MGVEAMVIAPANAAFFAFGLALLQGIIPREELTPAFAPRATI
jgi:predicted small integral membrane protein